jgi:hypothetical protein
MPHYKGCMSYCTLHKIPLNMLSRNFPPQSKWRSFPIQNCSSKWEEVQPYWRIIVQKNKLHTHDLKSAQLPNVTKNGIQISKTFPSVMGFIAKMNFEENKNLKSRNWKFEVKNLD